MLTMMQRGLEGEYDEAQRKYNSGRNAHYDAEGFRRETGESGTWCTHPVAMLTMMQRGLEG